MAQESRFFLKFRCYIFLFYFGFHSLNLKEIFKELFNSHGDWSYFVELDNFVTETYTAQADFQVVLLGAILTSHAWVTQASASTASHEIEIGIHFS